MPKVFACLTALPEFWISLTIELMQTNNQMMQTDYSLAAKNNCNTKQKMIIYFNLGIIISYNVLFWMIDFANNMFYRETKLIHLCLIINIVSYNLD